LLDKEEKSKVAAQLYGHDFKSPYGQEVQKLLKAGIGIHHAGLLPKYRILVEKLTQQGLLKVVCGTDTLGVGVNVPIRSVLFTGLSKYDGTGTKVLTVRDFKQIAGRAGRRGFDTVGYVVAQAPEHDIENIKLAQKTNKKGKPLQKRKAPDGFVGWSEQTFRKLIDAAPEKLVSSFQVRHNTLLNVFSREYEDGCFALKQLINGCHEPEIRKIKHRKNAWALFRGLVEGKVLEIIPPNQRDGGKKVKLNLELPEDFSMNQALGLWLMEALTELDREDSDYALNVISLVEAILENPSAILNQQERKMKDLRVAEMKQEGLGYDERMSILEEMSYPKPGEGFIYDSYNRFRESNPWVAGDSVRPKSIVRELIENYHSFAEYVKKYGLERSEGVFLRHLSEVYKVLTQTIPTSLKNEELIEAEVYLDEMLSEIDSSLVDEWKKLSNPDYDPEKEAEKRKSLQNELKYTDRKSVFHRALRQQSFAFVEAWAKEQWSRVFNLIERADPVGQEWARVDFEDIIDEYYENHENVLTDPEARSAKFFRLKENSENADHLYIEQTLTDPDGANDWMVKFEVSKNKCDEAKKVVLSLVNILPIGE